MRTIAIDNPGVCQPISLSDIRLLCTKTTERIDVLFGPKIHGGPMNIVLNGRGPDLPRRGKGGWMRPSQNYFGLLFTNHRRQNCAYTEKRTQFATDYTEAMHHLLQSMTMCEITLKHLFILAPRRTYYPFGVAYLTR